MGSLACAIQGFQAMPREAGFALFTSETFRREASWVPPQKQKLDPVDQVSTLWITLTPSRPAKRVSRVGLAVSAVALFGCQKDSCFCSWTLWITTLTLRIRLRPSGSAPIEQQGQRVGSASISAGPFRLCCASRCSRRSPDHVRPSRHGRTRPSLLRRLPRGPGRHSLRRHGRNEHS